MTVHEWEVIQLFPTLPVAQRLAQTMTVQPQLALDAAEHYVAMADIAEWAITGYTFDRRPR